MVLFWPYLEVDVGLLVRIAITFSKSICTIPPLFYILSTHYSQPMIMDFLLESIGEVDRIYFKVMITNKIP